MSPFVKFTCDTEMTRVRAVIAPCRRVAARVVARTRDGAAAYAVLVNVGEFVHAALVGRRVVLLEPERIGNDGQ